MKRPGNTVGLVTEALHLLRQSLVHIGPDVAQESLLSEQATNVLLSDWIDSITEASLTNLVDTAVPSSSGTVTTLAPGNLPIVAAECVILGVLAGIDHDLLLSSRATVLARAVRQALITCDPSVEQRLRLHRWRTLDATAQSTLLEASRVIV